MSDNRGFNTPSRRISCFVKPESKKNFFEEGNINNSPNNKKQSAKKVNLVFKSKNTMKEINHLNKTKSKGEKTSLVLENAKNEGIEKHKTMKNKKIGLSNAKSKKKRKLDLESPNSDTKDEKNKKDESKSVNKV